MLKKIMIIIFIILVILSLLMITLVKAKRVYSKEKVKELLISGISNLNYSYVDTQTDGSIVKVLGTKDVQEKGNGTKVYSDYEKKTSVLINFRFLYKENYTNFGIEDTSYYKQFIKEYFDSDIYEYDYIGKKKYRDINCIVVEFVNKTSIVKNNNSVKLWINESLNVIEKAEYYDNNSKATKTEEFYFYSGKIVLKDVTIPQNILEKCVDEIKE